MSAWAYDLLDSPRLPRVGIALLAIGASGAIALRPDMALYALGAVVGLFLFLGLIKQPLVGVGLCVTLVISGGLSQIASGAIFQRLYSITFVLTAAALLHHAYSDRDLLREWLRIRRSDAPVALFVLVAAMSVFVAERFGVAVSRFTLLGKGVLLYFLLTRAIRTRDDLIFVARFALVGGILQALSTRTSSAFQATDSNNVARVSGNLKDVNSFAGALMPIVPWAFFFSFFSRSKVFRVIGIIGLAVIPSALLGSISRTALVVLIGIGILWPLVSANSFNDRLIYTTISLVAVIFAVSIYWDALQTRWSLLRDLTNESNVTYVVQDDGGRSLLRAVAWDIAQEHWVLGLGIGNGAYEIGYRTNRTSYFYAHNMFMNVAADTGITGMVVFILMITAAYLGAIVTLFRLKAPLDRGLCATAIAALTSWVTFGITLNMEYQNYGYCLLALAFVVPTLLNEPAEAAAPVAGRSGALSAEAA